MQFAGRTFDVRDARGGNVFRASRDEVRVFAEVFAVESVGGLTVKNAIQAPMIRAPPASNLS